MSKWILTLGLLFSSPLWPQDDEQLIDDQIVEDDLMEETRIEEGAEMDAEIPQEQECVCPPTNETQLMEESVVNEQLIPAPQSSPVQFEEEQTETSDLPSGYSEKLPPGYSNESYKEIGSY